MVPGGNPGKKRFTQVPHCIHCKTCDIKSPFDQYRLDTPEAAVALIQRNIRLHWRIIEAFLRPNVFDLRRGPRNNCEIWRLGFFARIEASPTNGLAVSATGGRAVDAPMVRAPIL